MAVIKRYNQLPDATLDCVLHRALGERCEQAGICLEETFNLAWLRGWVRAGLPCQRNDQDWSRQILLEPFAEAIRTLLDEILTDD